MSSHLQILQARPSTGSNTLSRPGFKLYILVANGSGSPVSGQPTHSEFESLGIGYGSGIGLHSVTNSTTVHNDATSVKNAIDSAVSSGDIYPRLLYLDYEAGGDTAPDILNATGWVRDIIGTSGTYGAVGWYGGSQLGMSSPGATYPFSWSPTLVSSAQSSNDTRVVGVQGTSPQNTEWLGPELYCNMNIDRLYCHLNWFSLEYTRLGHVVPLIPLINPRYPPGRSFSGTAIPGDYWRAILECGIRMPNVHGFFIWHADRSGAWDNAEPWYTETLDFISTYGLSVGTPF